MSQEYKNGTAEENKVIFMPSGRREEIPAGTSLLDAARTMGVEIESICGGKLTCGKCMVRVEDGVFQKHGITSSSSNVTPASEKERELLDRMGNSEYRLSCQCFVQGDVLAFVPEEARAQKQVIRKAASDKQIDINPAVRKVYVEVDTAELGEHRGDWGRLQDALAAQWQLENLSIDWLVLRRLQSVLRRDGWKVTVTIWQDREVIDVQSGYVEGTYGLAVDIGSTTIAGYLCDLRTGEVLATESQMNPQITYGEDLMSRVSFAMTDKDGTSKMHKAVLKALNSIASRIAAQIDLKARDIHEAVFVGNTTMTHLLLGINPIELGGAPFALATRDGMDVKARELGVRLHEGAWVHVLPSEAGHVGGDNVSALISEEPYNQLEEQILMVDIGTNAEITLGNQTVMYSASSPTGPAFEGAQIAYGMRAAPGAIERVRIDPETKVGRFRVIGEERWSDEWQLGDDVPDFERPGQLAAGICGSGIIEVIAEMFLAEIILPDGKFNPALAEHERIAFDGRSGKYMLSTAVESRTGEPIYVTQDDVRAIQLAKAALYAGCKLLMNRAGLKAVDRIVLAGAFGSFIDTKYAMLLGLIPDCELDKVNAAGNAAGDGARVALLNKAKRLEAQRIAEWVTYVETAVDPSFQDEFVGAIAIPHASDAYPHLEGILPAHLAPSKEKAGAEEGGGRRRRRRRK